MMFLFSSAAWLWQAGSAAEPIEIGWLLAGLGALAAGGGILKIGWSLGRASNRVTTAFESYVQGTLIRHEEMMGVAREGVALARGIQQDQKELHTEVRALRSGLGGIWDEMGTIPRGERRG